MKHNRAIRRASLVLSALCLLAAPTFAEDDVLLAPPVAEPAEELEAFDLPLPAPEATDPVEDIAVASIEELSAYPVEKDYIMYGEAFHFHITGAPEFDHLRLDMYAFLGINTSNQRAVYKKLTYELPRTAFNEYELIPEPGSYFTSDVAAVSNGVDVASGSLCTPNVIRPRDDIRLFNCPDQLLTKQEFEPGVTGSWGDSDTDSDPHLGGGMMVFGDGESRELSGVDPTHRYSYAEPGQYTVYAIFHDHGEFYGTVPKTVTVTAPYGTLVDDFTYDVPKTVHIGEDLVIGVRGDNAEHWVFYATFINKNGDNTGCRLTAVDGKLTIDSEQLRFYEDSGYTLAHIRPLPGPGTTSSSGKVTPVSVRVLPALTPTPKPTATPKPTPRIVRSQSLKYRVSNGKATLIGSTNKNLKTLTVPERFKITGSEVESFKVVAIGANAFKGMKKLIRVTVGSKVTTIGKGAFSGCKALKAITLGAGVKIIGNKAFYGCKALKTITIKSSKLTSKTMGKAAFKGINARPTFTCPKKKLSSYKKLLKAAGAPKASRFRK